MNKKKGSAFKNAFSFFELIIVVVLIAFISYFFLKPNSPNELQQATNRLLIYLKQTRLQAFIQDFHASNDPLWHKKRWILKFFRCRASVGGLYYVIYSDTNQTGHPSAQESLKDPLTKKNIYSSNRCQESKFNSNYVLLSQKYNISDVWVSCNTTNALGQISFGANGKLYSQLSSTEEAFYNYEVKKPCQIKITHKNGTSQSIIIENETGYIHTTH